MNKKIPRLDKRDLTGQASLDSKPRKTVGLLRGEKPIRRFGCLFVVFVSLLGVLGFGENARAQTWQETLEPHFDIVETFDQLQDWTGTVTNSCSDPEDMPIKLNGSSSIWGYYSCFRGTPNPEQKWIGDHGAENVSGGSGKSLCIDYDYTGDEQDKKGPERLGVYLGDGDPNTGPYSGYGDVYIFYMSKIPRNFYHQDGDDFLGFAYHKFLQVSTGFRDIFHWGTLEEYDIARDRSQARNIYGLNFIMMYIQAYPNQNGDLTIKEGSFFAVWDPVELYYDYDHIADRKIASATIKDFVNNNEWFGIEYRFNFGTVDQADGHIEVYIYDKNGNEVGAYIGPNEQYLAVFDHKINKFVLGGNRDWHDSNLSHLYIDDFIIDNNRIGPTYFNLLNGVPDTTPPTRSNPQPTGTLSSGTTSTTISLDTDETAICKYSTTANIAYDDMTLQLNSGQANTHTATVSNLEDGNSYPYYIRCQDELNNQNTDDFEISFSIASSTTYSISNFINLVTDWLKSESGLESDVNGDGVVNTRDLGIMMSNWQ